jgi:hypothetical protein
MKIELGHTTWEGCWQECALCGEGFRAYEVQARTTLPGEYCERPACRQCALAGEQGLKQRLRCLRPGTYATWPIGWSRRARKE